METRKEGLLPVLVVVVVVVAEVGVVVVEGGGGGGFLVCRDDGMGQTWKDAHNFCSYSTDQKSALCHNQQFL